MLDVSATSLANFAFRRRSGLQHASIASSLKFSRLLLCTVVTVANGVLHMIAQVNEIGRLWNIDLLGRCDAEKSGKIE